MAPHSSILAWGIPWRSLVGYSSWSRKELDTNERLNTRVGLDFLLLTLELKIIQC